VQRSRGPNGHAPARDGKCLDCHDPHLGSESGALLRVSQRELCGRCHDASAATFKAKHHGFATGQGSCTSCHDPHGTGKSGLVNAFQHAPYAEGSCDVCHQADGQLLATGVELCASCHADQASGDKKTLHAAVTTGKGCSSCHAPHAGRAEKLLVRENLAETCFACHDRRMFEHSRKHPDVTTCTTCHEPHGSPQRQLLVQSQDRLCSQCHDPAEKHSHPYGPPARDPRTGEPLRCASCHNPHSSEQESLLTHSKSRELCIQCHRGPNLEVRGRGTR